MLNMQAEIQGVEDGLEHIDLKYVVGWGEGGSGVGESEGCRSPRVRVGTEESEVTEKEIRYCLFLEFGIKF